MNTLQLTRITPTSGIVGTGFGPLQGSGTAIVGGVTSDTHTIQALNAAGQSITGLTWTSSGPTIVSLSTDDPPVLTAMAVGHVTISAGGASADVTVSPTLALGTVLWSNPGDGSGVYKIVPAVPSSSGVADVFAFQNDGTVQAITSDGTTAWTATASASQAVPDFQGGLIVSNYDSTTNTYSVTKLDGITGQPHSSYSLGPDQDLLGLVVHPDGTAFAVERDNSDWTINVIGLDPVTGTEKFSVPVTDSNSQPISGFGWSDTDFIAPIVAGDGFAYLAYVYRNDPCDGIENLALLRISSSGASSNISIVARQANTCEWDGLRGSIISNADTGVWVTWLAADYSVPYSDTFGMASVTGTSVSVVNAFQLPGQSDRVVPVLQAQDGSFIGTVDTENASYMVSFDQSGNLHWSVPGNWQPQIATDDGGLIATQVDSHSNPVGTVTFDQNGNATGQLSSFSYSWFGNSYQVGSVDQLLGVLINVADSFWAFSQGNASHTGVANRPLAKTVQQLVAQIAQGYVGSTNWVGQGVACNIFVKQVLQDAGQQVPYSTNWFRRALDIFGLLNSPLYYPALAGDWASRTTALGCWHNVTVPSDRLGGYPADLSRPGDVIAEAINYTDATGHVGIVVGPQQTASADSAAACMSNGAIPAEIIDVTNYGFRPDGWASTQTYPNGVPCSTNGWKSKAVVKRFACQ